MSRLSDQRGFTLVELLVTMTIGMAALGGVLTILEVMLRQSHQNRQQSEAQDQARAATDRLAGSLRNAISSPGVAPSAIERDGAYDLIFQTVDPFTAPTAGGNVLSAMRIRYCLDTSTPSNGLLRMQTQKWTTATAPAVPAATTCTAAAAGWDDNRIVAGNIVNRLRAPERPVFTFTPATYASTAAIRSVGTTLAIDQDPASVRGERTLTSGVGLRNANQAPEAEFTVSQAAGYVMLNASGSFDPDGDSLTFKWFMDNVEQPNETGRIFRRAGLSPRDYLFRLEVRDSSGLMKSTERVVTVS